jgi:hypothetical protein
MSATLQLYLSIENEKTIIYVYCDNIYYTVHSFAYNNHGYAYIDLEEFIDGSHRLERISDFYETILVKVKDNPIFTCVECAVLCEQLDIAYDRIDPDIRGKVTAISTYMSELQQTMGIDDLQTYDTNQLIGMMTLMSVTV